MFRHRPPPSEIDEYFLEEITFYFNNCPEVPKKTFSCNFYTQNNDQFIKEVQSISMEALSKVSIKEHRYNPDYPTRNNFKAFATNPVLPSSILTYINTLDCICPNKEFTDLRLDLFQTILTGYKENSLLYMFQHNTWIHEYIISTVEDLFRLYRFVTQENTPVVIRPRTNTDYDYRYVDDTGILERITTPTITKYTTKCRIFRNEQINKYMNRPRCKYAQSHAVVFAYCMQKWCEAAISSFYYDLDFYKEIVPDGNPSLVLYFVIKVILRIESIMLMVLQQSEENYNELRAIKAIGPANQPKDTFSSITDILIETGFIDMF